METSLSASFSRFRQQVDRACEAIVREAINDNLGRLKNGHTTVTRSAPAVAKMLATRRTKAPAKAKAAPADNAVEVQIEAVMAALQDGPLNFKELISKLDIKEPALRSILQRLRDQKLIVTEGQKRGTKYKLVG